MEVKFNVSVDGQGIRAENIRLVRGTENVYIAKFQFSDEWGDFGKIAKFRNEQGGEPVSKAIDALNECVMPASVLAGRYVFIGVEGDNEEPQVYPTIWTGPLYVEDGAVGGTDIPDPEQTEYQEIIALINAGKLAGATFTPSVNDEGVISWDNDRELPNPEPKDIKGPHGAPGPPGTTSWNGITDRPETFPPSAHNHDDRYYTQNDTDILLGEKEDTSNKTETIDSSSTSDQYPSAAAVYEALEEVREVAEGKTATFVISNVANPDFNSQADTVTITDPIILISGVEVPISDIKVGDNVLVTELDVPDRWCASNDGASCVFSKLETAKVDLTNYARKTDYGTSTVGGTFKTGNSFSQNDGVPYAVTRPLEQYNQFGNSIFIGKGTLENIKDNYVKQGITENAISLSDAEKAAARGWMGVQNQHKTATVTLAAASWSNKEQAVSVTGVTATNTLIVSPAVSNINPYVAAGVYAYSQAAGQIVFKCETVPTVNLSVEVVILD